MKDTKMTHVDGIRGVINQLLWDKGYNRSKDKHRQNAKERNSGDGAPTEIRTRARFEDVRFYHQQSTPSYHNSAPNVTYFWNGWWYTPRPSRRHRYWSEKYTTAENGHIITRSLTHISFEWATINCSHPWALIAHIYHPSTGVDSKSNVEPDMRGPQFPVDNQQKAQPRSG